MDTPLVSIVIPVYNGANYMREAIDSALAQTYPNVEIIVVNDGSIDKGETERIALSYGDRIRYLSKKNGGVATALNYALEEMKGEYFSWLSHDDLYYPQKLERQLQALQASGNMTAIVLSDLDVMDTNVVVSRLKINSRFTTTQLQNSVFAILEGLINGCALLIHKSHFDRVGRFDESLITTQDYDLWFRMFRHQRLLYVPEALVISRLHSAQGSRTIQQHERERNDLYIRFLKELTVEEIVSMYGTEYQFYCRMNELFRNFKLNAAYRYSNEQLQSKEVPYFVYDEIRGLSYNLNRMSEGRADRVCIFGAGAYGTRLCESLVSRMIQVDNFCDNNPEKWGTVVNGVPCISPSQLVEMKERTLVIVAVATPEPIVQQLETMGVSFVTTKQELDPMLDKTALLKWVSALETVEGIDYTTDNISVLINQYKKIVVDMGNRLLS
ncbi:glycosyltransferase [Cohnella sp. GbtcB17]|uniref:glycosyltransferase n=1 Tax=Cohnella sp. GbtcB17 TaxID=2824762 RepID=UPI001C2F8F9B|nr:glycosyltransferase [Cohnella sp. GbtcB17]